MNNLSSKLGSVQNIHNIISAHLRNIKNGLSFYLANSTCNIEVIAFTRSVVSGLWTFAVYAVDSFIFLA